MYISPSLPRGTIPYVRSTVRTLSAFAVPQVRTVPDMRNIHDILTTIGHRFGHQSGLDESSGQVSTIFRHGIAIRVCLMFL